MLGVFEEELVDIGIQHALGVKMMRFVIGERALAGFEAIPRR